MGDAPIKICEQCYAFSPSACKRCAQCGAYFYVERKKKETK